MVKLDGQFGAIEMRQLHDPIIVEVGDELVSVPTHLVQVVIPFGNRDPDVRKQVGLELLKLVLLDDLPPKMLSLFIGEQLTEFQNAQIKAVVGHRTPEAGV